MRCGFNAAGDAVCNTECGKAVSILRRQLYESNREFRDALYYECGSACTKYLPKNKNHKRSKESEVKLPVNYAVLAGKVMVVCGSVVVVLLVAGRVFGVM